MRAARSDHLGTLIRRVGRLGLYLSLCGSTLHIGARPALGGETIFAGFENCLSRPTSGQYANIIDVTLEGWGTIGPDGHAVDAFYRLSPNDPGVALGSNGGEFRFSRSDQGACTCEVQCAGRNQPVSDALIGPIPPFNPAHRYQVRMSVGAASPQNLTFGAGDCRCTGDTAGISVDTGGITVAIAGCATDPQTEDCNPCISVSCSQGVCTRATSSDDCDDGDPCTSNDKCDPSGQCTGARACFPGGMRLRPTRPVLLLGSFGGAVAVTGDTIVIGAGSEASQRGIEGAVYVYAASTGELLYRLSNPEPLLSNFGPNFGGALAVDRNVLLVGAPGQSAQAGAAWTFDLTTGTRLASLVNPSPAPQDLLPDFFGMAVALAGSKAIVSAAYQEGGGAVYVFDAASGALLKTLVRPGSGDATGFGSSIGILGDRLLVGDPGAIGAGNGAIHLFDLATGTYLASWWNPGLEPGFGFKLVVSGTDVVAGTFSGINVVDVVYVIDGATGTVLQKFPNPTPRLQGGDGYGLSLAIAAGRLAVGAFAADGGGKLHVFDLASVSLVRTIVDPVPNDPALVSLGEFGVALAVLAPSSVLVGAPNDADVRGTVYVLDASAATIVGGFQPPTGSSSFGQAIAGRGSEVFVGAPGEYYWHPVNGGKPGGRVYRYIDGVAAGVIVDPSFADGDRFGAAIAADAERVAVGAPGTARGAGKAFILLPDKYLPLVAPDGADGDGLGTSVGLANGTVVVGAPYTDGGAEDAGSVLEFDADTGALFRVLTAPVPSEGAYFGAAVAGNGASALVGAPFDDAGGGRVYLADAPSGEIVRSFPDPGAKPRSLFGSAVAWVGNQVLVGAPLEEAVDHGTALADAGAAYLFDAASGALLHTFRSPAPRRGAQFGFSVAGLGADVLVGAPLDEGHPTTIDTGTVYRFLATGELVGQYESLAPGAREQFGFALGSLGTNVLAGAPGSRSAYVLTGPPSAASVPRWSQIGARAERAAGDAGPACLGGYCHDGNPCTRDVCDVSAGGCVFEPIPGCGCSTDLECSDDVTCDGVERCVTCDGCFLHAWRCCGRVAHCAAGRELPDGRSCYDGGCGASAGHCRSGACVCDAVQPQQDCSICHDDDPCTDDRCDADAGCRFEPVTGQLAVTCAFDRPFPGVACAGQPVPKVIGLRFASARRAVVAARSGAPKRQRALLKTAVRLLKKARSAVGRTRRHRRAVLSTACSDDLTQLLRDAEMRVRAALDR